MWRGFGGMSQRPAIHRTPQAAASDPGAAEVSLMVSPGSGLGEIALPARRRPVQARPFHPSAPVQRRPDGHRPGAQEPRPIAIPELRPHDADDQAVGRPWIQNRCRSRPTSCLRACREIGDGMYVVSSTRPFLLRRPRRTMHPSPLRSTAYRTRAWSTLQIAGRAEACSLGTATPNQIDRMELYGLMRILHRGCERILGGIGSNWRPKPPEAMDVRAGRSEPPDFCRTGRVAGQDHDMHCG